MEEIVAKYGWKKVAIVIVVVCFLGLAYVANSFSNMDKIKVPEGMEKSGIIKSQK